MIFWLFISYRLFSFLLSFALSLPGEVRESQDLWRSPHYMVRLWGNRAEEAQAGPQKLDNLPNTHDFSDSSSWQIIKISQRENWLWFFKVACNYYGWYLRGIFSFRLCQHHYEPSIILAGFHYIIFFKLNCIMIYLNNIFKEAFYLKKTKQKP